jgi:cyclopropane fatty-acyl-phospholipid synthase-like methyltransferase
VTKVLLGAARPEAGERVLDIGCGAGAQTFARARAVA